MAKGHTSSGKCVAADIAAIAQASTIVDGVGFTSQPFEVWDVQKLVVQGYVEGEDGAANGDVDFVFVGSLDGTLWDTIAIATLTITMAGTAQIVESLQINVEGYHSIKLLSIQNKDASKDAEAVNVQWGKAFGGY